VYNNALLQNSSQQSRYQVRNEKGRFSLPPDAPQQPAYTLQQLPITNTALQQATQQLLQQHAYATAAQFATPPAPQAYQAQAAEFHTQQHVIVPSPQYAATPSASAQRKDVQDNSQASVSGNSSSSISHSGGVSSLANVNVMNNAGAIHAFSSVASANSTAASSSFSGAGTASSSQAPLASSSLSAGSAINTGTASAFSSVGGSSKEHVHSVFSRIIQASAPGMPLSAGAFGATSAFTSVGSANNAASAFSSFSNSSLAGGKRGFPFSESTRMSCPKHKRVMCSCRRAAIENSTNTVATGDDTKVPDSNPVSNNAPILSHASHIDEASSRTQVGEYAACTNNTGSTEKMQT
jgi:hypothetical protein